MKRDRFAILTGALDDDLFAAPSRRKRRSVTFVFR